MQESQPLTDLDRSKRMLHALREAQAELRALRRENADLVKEKRTSDACALLEDEVWRLRHALHRVQNSRSWKVTRWLRVIEPMIRHWRQ